MNAGRDVIASHQAERAVLGGVMLDGFRMAELADRVHFQHFEREAHRRIWQVMLAMFRENSPIEMVSVVEAIREKGLTDAAGGVAYVSALSDDVPSSENLEYYAGIVRDRWLQRQVVEAGRVTMEEAQSGGLSAFELVAKAEARFLGLGEQAEARDWVAPLDAADEAIRHIVGVAENPGEVTGMSTGLTDLDRVLAGLHRTDLIILAARPAMGKTALALNIAKSVASEGGGVGIFSLEMGRRQLTTRVLVDRASVPAGKVRTGHVSPAELERLQEAAAWFAALPVFIDDTPGQTITQIRARARRLHQQMAREGRSLDLIVVDYIGLMQGEGQENRQQQISEASRGLKVLAKELDLTVLALSQLNRQVENRNPKIPQLSDLRESGAIEQDADVIMFIYRDEYYNPETTNRPGIAEVIVAKQRGGETRTVEVAFQGEFTRFSDLARDDGGYL